MSEILSAVDHIGSIFAIVSFPSAVAGIGLIQLWRHEKMSAFKKWLPRLLLAIAAVAYLADIGDRFGFIQLGAKPQVGFDQTVQLQPIVGRHFINERVILDGKEFTNCTFENVTFVFNGTARFNLIGNQISGTRFFASDNGPINGALVVLISLGWLPKDMRIEGLPPTIQRPN